MRGNKKLFLSAVSSELVSYRNLLAADLKRPNLDVAVQEDFGVTGGTTLGKLDTYIRHCDAVIHLIGKAAGAVPEGPAVPALLAKYPDLGARLPPLAEDLRKPEPGFSYTQWEAYLAIYHRRPLFVYRPTDFELDAVHVPRDARFDFSPREAQLQKEHYRRISALGHDRGLFLNEERLSSAVLRDLVEILPRLESTVHVTPTKLRHAAERLIGRDEDLSGLDAAWSDPHKNVVIVRAFGGMGKTSLVATWMAELALKNWRGAERVFDWSFYSQGTRGQGAASADTFIAEALRAFGDPDPTLGSPWDRGTRLASLVSKSRCLLVLDGLEPLQHPPGPMEGQLKDSGLSALLKGLAARNAGLCVVTTREKVDDIKQHYGRTADDVPLTRLTDLAGAALLHYAGARRAGAMAIAPDDRELRAASREVRGHGLTLHLLGRYLRLVEDGDIRKRDTVRLADADEQYQNDATRPYGNAFKAMEAYEKWFAGEGEKGLRQLAVLRLLGVFDRPASKDCLEALRAEPVIAGLTEALVRLNPREWKLALSRLEEINLLAIQDDGSVDCHPLLREYFATQLRRQQPEAWRAAHRRLYEYLSATTKEGHQPTLEDLQPLYQAAAHGCQAGLQQEACENVYYARITRREEKYALKKLGAFDSDLGAVACFFEQPWSRVSPALTEIWQAWLLSEAAFRLRAMGRLTEALEPMRAALEMGIKQENWKSTALRASNLSELELTLGEVAGAVGDAEQSVIYADRSGDADSQNPRAAHADVLHQAGRKAEAEARFREAEEMQAKDQPAHPVLYSVQGFQYCDLLLTAAERAAWRVIGSGGPRAPEAGDAHRATLRAVSQREAKTLKWVEAARMDILSIALHHLTLGRAALYTAILEGSSVGPCRAPLQHAVAGLRRAGDTTRLPRGLLTRAWLRFLEGHNTGPDSAQSDLDEAWEIAERGPMPLIMAEILLCRVRLFGLSEWEARAKNEWSAYPWGTVESDLSEARRLIEKHGYWRRREELEDAEEFLRTPSNYRHANKSETSARKLMSRGDLLGAWAKLVEAIDADAFRKPRISQEFEFAFSFEGALDAASPLTKQDADALDWRRRVWSVLSKGSDAQFQNAIPQVTADTPIPDNARTVESGAAVAVASSSATSTTPEQRGELLEQAVSRLFRAFFKLGDETPWKIRTQKRGTQGGYDLSIEWSGKYEVKSDQRVRVHIECKNYREAISHNEVGGKLLVEGIVDPPVIEHWILISPHTDASNELNRFLESEQKNPRYSFDIQIWSPETGVREFFGLEPEVFALFYESEDDEPHPRTWDEVKRGAIRNKWMARLAPSLRVPAGWTDYLRNPAKLCTPPEDPEKFHETDVNHVAMRCKNSAGALLEKPLRVYVEEWLNQPNKPSLFLLGEFGDGKTSFTYVLARQLVEAWLENRERGWLPLRLTLKKYPGNAREFLRQRLEEFEADVAGWIEMGKRAKRLVILDGFDEMSVKVGPAAVTKNIGDLLSCVKEFEGCKIIITSRTHFFENRQDAQRLLTRLGHPAVYHLAPIERKEALGSTESHLVRVVGPEQARERLSRIDQMNDPIGLARKPLFLEMLKVVLSSPQMPGDLTVHDLYESYIDQSLKRNDDRLDDGDFRANPSEIIPNMRRILGELAEELQRSGRTCVSLNQFQAKGEKPIAELLWRLSGGEEMEKDARTRVGARSLLGRVVAESDDGEWLVDFCHRSMREYFVAIRLCDAVEAGLEAGQSFLKEVPLNHEILQFAAERWRKMGATALASERLLGLIGQAQQMNSPGSLGGYALTLLYRLNPDLPRHHDWKRKVFNGADLEDADLSEMDFGGSSFVAANLANVNFEKANFEGCDLTGVRLEETKAVVSLEASPSGDELIALYGDGVLREWLVKSGSKMSSTVVGSMKAELGAVIGVHESGQAWVRCPEEWMFLSRSVQPWSAEGVFPIKEGYECIHAEGGHLAFTKRIKEDIVELSLIDLESQRIIEVKEVKQALWCAALGDEAFVWSDSAVGLRVDRVRSSASTERLVLEMPLEPTCLDVWRCDSREYLVAAGTGDGQVLAWKVDLKADGWSSEKLLETQAHQGAVTTVAFTRESRVASGGSDRAIALTRIIGTEDLAGTQENRLQRTLRCSGMKIDGVRGPAEYETLRAFIAQSEEESR